MSSFDIKLLFLSFLGSYHYNYGYNMDYFSPAFNFLAAKTAFLISAEQFTDELKKDYFDNLK